MSANISPSLAILDDLANTEESIQTYGQTILDALREFKNSAVADKEVFVFTDRTPGHIWNIRMSKTDNCFSGFEFAGFHQPPPCSAFCDTGMKQLLSSEHLHLVYRRVGDHIAEIANSSAEICCKHESV